MNHVRLNAAVVLGTLFVSASLVQAQATATPGSRKITVDEELWLRLADEPGHHMQESRDRFFRGDRTGAATHMRKAAVYLRLSAQNSTDPAGERLLSSAKELESLASQTEAGTLRSIRMLESAFARAHHALALHHHAMATESWGRRQQRIAGYRMRAAADATERSARWAGGEIQEGATAVYRGTRTLGGRLIEGTGVVVDEVGKGLGTIGRQIERVGEKVIPGDK